MEQEIGELILKEIKDFRKDMNGRVRSLEIWRGMVMGGLKVGLKVIAVVVGLGGLAFAIVKAV